MCHNAKTVKHIGVGWGGLGRVVGPAIILKLGRLYIKIAQIMKGKHVVMKYGRKSKEHVTLGKNRPSERRRLSPPPPPPSVDKHFGKFLKANFCNRLDNFGQRRSKFCQ